jgi:hypothetical protein
MFPRRGNSWYLCNLEIPKSGRKFHLDLNTTFNNPPSKKSPYLKIKKIIIHPGDASILKPSYLDPNWLLTKSDSSSCYLWNIERHKFIPSNKENIYADPPDITYFIFIKLSNILISDLSSFLIKLDLKFPLLVYY